MTRCKKYLLAVTILIVAVFFLAPPVLASGLVDDTINDAHGFSRYPIGHYALDLYIDPDAGRGFFGISLPDVSRILFSITNAIWELCVFLASAVGSVVQEAFRLDFLSRATDEIGRNIQQIAGVSESGFSNSGFLPMLLPLTVLALGAYILYVGIFKREMTKALGAVVNFLVIFILSIGFIAFAPAYIQAINGLSVDLADGVLRVTNAILNPAANDTEVAVAGIREALHQVQIHAPWQLLQFGSLDLDPARVQELLSQAPHSDGRIDAVIREVEVYGNIHLSGEVDRFGTVLVLFFINLGISIFVLSLTGLMIFSQLLLIFYLTLLPIALVLSLFPTFSGIAKRSIEQVFNTLLLRVGYTLIITVAFSLSLLVYRVSSELSMPFLLVGFLQILVFWGVHRKQDDLLGMLSFQSGENHRAEQSVLRTGRSLGRKALAFGKGMVVGKMISRRRPEQGANVAASSGSAEKHTTPMPIEAKHGQHKPSQNVATRPAKAEQTDQSEQARPVERPTLGGRVGHSMGKLVDTPAKLKDQAALTKAKVQDIPIHARYTVAQNTQQFRQSLSGAPKERRETRADKREQYRDKVEMKKRSLERPPQQDKQGGNVEIQRQTERSPILQKKPQEDTAQRGQARRDTPHSSTATKPRHAPAKNVATYKLNGEPVTIEQLEVANGKSEKRRSRRDGRDRGRS